MVDPRLNLLRIRHALLRPVRNGIKCFDLGAQMFRRLIEVVQG